MHWLIILIIGAVLICSFVSKHKETTFDIINILFFLLRIAVGGFLVIAAIAIWSSILN